MCRIKFCGNHLTPFDTSCLSTVSWQPGMPVVTEQPQNRYPKIVTISQTLVDGEVRNPSDLKAWKHCLYKQRWGCFSFTYPGKDHQILGERFHCEWQRQSKQQQQNKSRKRKPNQGAKTMLKMKYHDNYQREKTILHKWDEKWPENKIFNNFKNL